MELSRKQETAVALGLTTLCAAAYHWFGSRSPGFYQHDEVGHYLNMVEFWYDPRNIVTLWAKPGFKIFYVLPAKVGEWAVTLLTTLLAAGSGFIAYLIAREYKLRFALAAVLLCGLQPFFYQTGFRNYSEFLTAVVIGLGTLYYVKEKYLWAAFFFSYSFALRQETALITLIIGLTLLYRRQYLAFLMLGWTPLALNLVGWLAHGDPLWAITSVTEAGAKYDYPPMGFWHYWTWFIPIMGVVPTFFFLLGFAGEGFRPQRIQGHVKRYAVPYIVFSVYFLMYCLFVSEWFGLVKITGIMRTMLSISPLVSVFAVIGMEKVWGKDPLPLPAVFGVLGVLTALVLAFLSHKHTMDPRFTEEVDPARFAVLLFLGLVLAGTYFFKLPVRAAAILVVAASALNTFVSEEPQPISSEDQLCQEVADYFQAQNMQERPTLMNHVLFYYFTGVPRRYSEQYRFISLENLDQAAPGTIVLYDTHYGGNQEERGVITPQSMLDRPDLRVIRQFMAPDRRFGVLVFEKQPG